MFLARGRTAVSPTFQLPSNRSSVLHTTSSGSCDSYFKEDSTMRAFLAKISPLALLMGLAMPLHAAPPHKQPSPQAPLELKIIGPSFIHEGEAVKYKAALINRSSGPILVASRDSRLDFELAWTIRDSSGRELPRARFNGSVCPVGGKGWDQNLTRRMRDADLTILQPGEMLEFRFDDISDSYLFPSRGRYQVTFVYTYVPPQFEGRVGTPVDGFDAKYDLTDLSGSTLEALRHALPISVA